MLDSLFVSVKKLLRPGSFLAGFATLSAGAVISQAITICAAPILTRLYSPTEMGALAGLVAIATILGVVAAGRYDLAVVLPEKESDATVVALLGISFAWVVSAIVSLGFVFLGVSVAALLGLADLPLLWLNLVGVLVLLIGVGNVLQFLHIRAGRYRSLASAQVSQQLCANGVKVVAGIANAGVGGLFLGTVIGHIVRMFFLAFGEIKRIRKDLRFLSIVRFLKMARRYKKFPLISSWSALLNEGSVHLPVILFASIFSPAVAGYYALSYRILRLPMTFLGQNVNHVFVQKAAQARDNPDQMRRLTLGLYKRLLLVGAIGLSFVTYYGDILFLFVFGSEWTEAGKYAQWISTWLVFQLASVPVSGLYNILERQGEAFLFQGLLFVLRIASIVFSAILVNDPLWAIISYCLTSLLMYGALSVRLLRLVGVKYAQIVYHTMLSVVSPYLCQGVVWFIVRQMTH